jgi:hypothetical protein
MSFGGPITAMPLLTQSRSGLSLILVNESAARRR